MDQIEVYVKKNIEESEREIGRERGRLIYSEKYRVKER